MAITPQTARPALSSTNVLIGAPIGADQWQRAGALCNWLAARGAVLVPWCMPGVVATPSIPQTFRFFAQPRRAAIERRWYVELDASTATDVTLRAPDSGGVDATTAIPAGRSLLSYVETLTASSDASQEISITVEVVDDAEVTTRRIFCAEIDRASLEQDATDYGVDISTSAAGRPMFDPPAASGQSLGGVVEALANVDTRRAGIYHWTVGDTAVTRTSATPANLTALAVPVQAAKELRTDTEAVVMWTAYCRVTSAGKGTVTLTTSQSGISSSQDAGTSFAWTTPTAIAISCEDLADADGLLSGAFDDLTISIAGNGTVAIEVKSVSLYTDRAQSLIGG